MIINHWKAILEGDSFCFFTDGGICQRPSVVENIMLEQALGLLNCSTTSTVLSTFAYMATEVKAKLTDLEHCTNHMQWPLVS